MTIVTDILDRADHLAEKRQPWERVWLDTVKYALPMGERFLAQGPGARRAMIDDFAFGPRAEERGRDIFDATSVWSVDRLTAGLESLTTPSTEKWHGLKPTDPFAPEPSDAAQEWFDRYRDFLFAARYEPRAGFTLANQHAIRSAVALGTGVYLVEEAFERGEGGGTGQPFRYRPIPLSECFIATNAQGEPDTLYRRFTMSARQIVQKFGDRAADKVKAAADDPKDRDKQFALVHAVFPRAERAGAGAANPDAAFASVYVDEDHRHLIGESGFFEFPYVVYYWQQDADTGYGESPVMLALAEIKSLNLLSKHTMRAVQQWTNPPLGIPSDGVVKRPNLNPGAINPGVIDEQGRARVQPIVTAQNPTFIQQVLEVKREQLRESLFVNLFQILVQNPGMTATEALIRANEKGELLGPRRRQDPGRPRAPRRTRDRHPRPQGRVRGGQCACAPQELGGASFGVRFQSPLDRLRRANELIGVQRTYEFAGQIAQFDPSVLDRLDVDRALDLAQEINGAPRAIFRRDEEVAELRGAREDAAQAQGLIAGADQLAETANKAIPALRDSNDLLDEFGLADAFRPEAGRAGGADPDPGLPEPV